MNAFAPPTPSSLPEYFSRKEALRRSFAQSVQHLDHAEPDQIPNGYIQDYIAWGWLKRSYDGVHVTPTGDRALKSMS